MALTQWQGWAGKQGVSDIDTLFPRLRAAADLLMFPKDMLRDAATRAEILPALTLPQVCAIVTKFVPDDYAPDSVPRGLVYDLQAQVGCGWVGGEEGGCLYVHGCLVMVSALRVHCGSSTAALSLYISTHRKTSTHGLFFPHKTSCILLVSPPHNHCNQVPTRLSPQPPTQIPPGTPLFPDLTCPYECAEEATLLASDLVQQVSLDMDEESDDELDELEHLYAMPELGEEEGRVHRFTLLRELWASAR